MRRGVSPLPEWCMNMDITPMDIISDWGMPALSRIIKPKPFDEVPMEQRLM